MLHPFFFCVVWFTSTLVCFHLVIHDEHKWKLSYPYASHTGFVINKIIADFLYNVRSFSSSPPSLTENMLNERWHCLYMQKSFLYKLPAKWRRRPVFIPIDVCHSPELTCFSALLMALFQTTAKCSNCKAVVEINRNNQNKKENLHYKSISI